MINEDRIVPVTKIDLISLYGLIFIASGETVTALNAAAAQGEFEQTANSATVLASEPLKSLNFGSSVTAGTVYFVPDYDYSGFSIGGTAKTTTGATVKADGRTLYSAVLASGTITVAKIGF